MSRTLKDSRRNSVAQTVLEIVKRPDGAFDLFANGKLDQTQTEKCLPEWLCVKFGFCGKEYEVILSEAKSNGKAVVRF